MSEIVLQVNNVSKKYCHSLKKSMMYGCIDILRDSIGLKTQPDTLRKDEFWSVKDVSFSLERGQCLGIIGPNGAGKSTLLKMLNGIIKPDKGDIWYKGRMGALIEVGAGFQPVLSGRENIYINGSIIGLSSKEIKDKFDEIVEFSGLEEFLDMPVKNYSSGMRVRLGFSIAAHLHPDILLVDEVLAVGDLSFQAKCRNKIAEMTKDGTAIIFISHNMHQIANLCEYAVTLNKGQITTRASIIECIDKYKLLCTNENIIETGGSTIKITDVRLLDSRGVEQHHFSSNDSMSVEITYQSNVKNLDLTFAVIIRNSNGIPVISIRNDYDNIKIFSSRLGKVTLKLKTLNLLPDTFVLDVILLQTKFLVPLHRIDNVMKFQIPGGHFVEGVINIPHIWENIS